MYQNQMSCKRGGSIYARHLDLQNLPGEREAEGHDVGVAFFGFRFLATQKMELAQRGETHKLIFGIQEMNTKLKKPIKTVAIMLLGFIALITILNKLYPLNLPNQNNLYAKVVVDKHNRPLRAFPDKNGVWRYQVTLEEVSPYYIEALLNYEDRRFWYHPGIDPIAIVRAAVSNIKNGKVVSGGSTISMQVARLLHPHSRSLGGKFYQMLRTLQLEWQLSKKEILTLYCNIAPFGGTIEGVQAASFSYLDKPASELTYAEAALLAVLPQSPTRLRPDIHPQRAQHARDKVLDRLQTFNIWAPETIELARIEQVAAYRRKPPQHAPLLSRRLIQQTKYSSASVIKTTIDGELQASLEDYVRYYVEGLPNKTSAAVLVIDNKTSHALAYVGTAEFASAKHFGYVDMVSAIRSPGSTLKPFLYAMAFDEGLIHSQSLLNDTPQNWSGYRPENFSGGFSGPVSASEALQRSLNIPAVQLMDKFGPANFSARVQNAGVSLRIPNARANLAIILGGVGTRLEDLVLGYSAFANGGQARPIQTLQNTQPEQARYFFSPQAAWVTQKILSQVSRPNSIRGISALADKQKLAWKTGTSYGFRDSWAIGVDANYTIGVWVGRPDGTPTPGASGRSHAGPLLHAIADHLPHSRTPIAKPKQVEERDICWPLGTLKSEQDPAFCQQTHRAWIINETVPPTWPDKLSTLSENPVTVLIDNKTGLRVHPGCHSSNNTTQMKAALWPAELEPWLAQRYRRTNQLPALAPHCLATLSNEKTIKINGLEDGAIFRSTINSNQPPTITLQATGGEGNHLWYIDGKFLAATNNQSAKQIVLNDAGLHQVVVVDDAGNMDKIQIEKR